MYVQAFRMHTRHIHTNAKNSHARTHTYTHMHAFLHENEHVLLDEGVQERERERGASLQAQPAASMFVEYVWGEGR